jgi:DNA-binding transcriptional LysR family regulator
MELRHLRYFVAIAEEHSFTRAAERMWVAQPGLSTQMRRLESELGVRLLERHARGVDLTPAGELFLERARATLAAADAAAATGRDLEDGVVGSVRLGLATGLGWRGTAWVLERFSREREGVELTLTGGHELALWRDLRDGRADAVIVPEGTGSADLNKLRLGTEAWVVLVGRAHRLAGTGPLAASDLEGQTIAVTANRDGAVYDRAVAELLRELGVTATLLRGAPGPALYRAVARGEVLVLTTAPELVPVDVVVRKLDPTRRLAFELLWRDETSTPALREFVRIASQCCDPAPVGAPILAAVA